MSSEYLKGEWDKNKMDAPTEIVKKMILMGCAVVTGRDSLSGALDIECPSHCSVCPAQLKDHKGNHQGCGVRNAHKSIISVLNNNPGLIHAMRFLERFIT